jgi:hypothetical protein
VGHLQAAGFAVGYLQTGRDPARQPQAAALPWVTSRRTRPAALAVGQLQSVHCGHGKPPVQAGVALSVAKPPDLLQAVDHLQPWVMDGGTTAGTNLREKKEKKTVDFWQKNQLKSGMFFDFDFEFFFFFFFFFFF